MLSFGIGLIVFGAHMACTEIRKYSMAILYGYTHQAHFC